MDHGKGMMAADAAVGDSQLREFPMGKANFEKVRKNELCLYVDKTAILAPLLANAVDSFFLARPRMFGKSLLISTLKAIFEGKRELFEGLAITTDPALRDCVDWKEYPIIYLDFSKLEVAKGLDLLEKQLIERLQAIASSYGVDVTVTPPADVPVVTDKLILGLSELGEQHGLGRNCVVILVDEYDAPIVGVLDANGGGAQEKAKANANVMSAFFKIVKACSAERKFTFVTGVSKFGKTALFSSPNFLRDITRPEIFGHFGIHVEGDCLVIRCTT